MQPFYEAEQLRALAQILRNGHIYKGLKPVHWCLDCRSALAEAEVEYHDRQSPALDVRFRVVDEAEFLSPHGVRSLSRRHLEEPYRLAIDGAAYEIAYQPGVSGNRVFGGNSNWRGPIWFPMNVLLIQALGTFARYYGDSIALECPRGSGVERTLPEIAAEIAARLTRIFVRDEANGGRRVVFGDRSRMHHDVHWRDCIAFHEFFHGETGEGLGASHQTGWTALVALLLQHRGRLWFGEGAVPRPQTDREVIA
jgi:hypothetical protein